MVKAQQISGTGSQGKKKKKKLLILAICHFADNGNDVGFNMTDPYNEKYLTTITLFLYLIASNANA